MKQLLFSLVLIPSLAFAGGAPAVHIDKAPINPQDKTSLQRGAKFFMNNCLGCHSLKYMRYKQMAEGIGLVTPTGEVDKAAMAREFSVKGSQLVAPITSSLPDTLANQWFGIVPPDLSLITRVRGTDWVYTFLRSFYSDGEPPWGINNELFPDVGMPNVFVNYQGVQVPEHTHISHVDQDGETVYVKVVDSLKLTKAGSMSPQEFNQTITDLVNFLSYAAEPAKAERLHIGLWVLGFLFVFLLFAIILKREFWRDIH